MIDPYEEMRDAIIELDNCATATMLANRLGLKYNTVVDRLIAMRQRGWIVRRRLAGGMAWFVSVRNFARTERWS